MCHTLCIIFHIVNIIYHNTLIIYVYYTILHHTLQYVLSYLYIISCHVNRLGPDDLFSAKMNRYNF